MTSFSGLREVSLLASLNGSLRWPRYGRKSSQGAVFNQTISLTSPQVVARLSRHLNTSCHLYRSLHIKVCVSPRPARLALNTSIIWTSPYSKCLHLNAVKLKDLRLADMSQNFYLGVFCPSPTFIIGPVPPRWVICYYPKPPRLCLTWISACQRRVLVIYMEGKTTGSASRFHGISHLSWRIISHKLKKPPLWGGSSPNTLCKNKISPN